LILSVSQADFAVAKCQVVSEQFIMSIYSSLSDILPPHLCEVIVLRSHYLVIGRRAVPPNKRQARKPFRPIVRVDISLRRSKREGKVRPNDEKLKHKLSLNTLDGIGVCTYSRRLGFSLMVVQLAR